MSSAALADVPERVRALAKRSIFDGLGLAVAGGAAGSGRILRAYLPGVAARGPSRVLGSDLALAPRFAAFANGVAIHADDYDDTQLAAAPDRVYGLLTHPTAPVLPAALALAERDGRSGADLLVAYLVGVEVACKVAEAIAPRHYEEGFHSTGTAGAIGAAAASARILGCAPEAVARALGVGASQAAGLRENFGTMTKPLHAGRAAESGVVAAELAASGWTASAEILEAPRGFFRAAGGGYDAAAIEGRLGAPWIFDRPGVSIKPHPCGSLTHPAMGVLLHLLRAHDVRAPEVRRVRVGTNRQMPNALIHHRPRTELEAKFSMEFCMAILILERRAGLAEFTETVVARPDVRALVEKVTFEVDPEAEAAGYDRMTSVVELELADGRVLRGRADYAKGSPADPLSADELLEKFRECVVWGGLPRERAERAAELVLRIEDVRDVRQLTAALVPERG